MNEMKNIHNNLPELSSYIYRSCFSLVSLAKKKKKKDSVYFQRRFRRTANFIFLLAETTKFEVLKF